MNYDESFLEPVPPLSPRIYLEIRGLGHVPSFKNGKMKTRNGLITDPKKKKWMDAATQLIASQLQSAFQTNETGTSTEHLAPSRIALSMPLDDSRKWIVSISASAQIVSKGEEGASIMIERVT